MANLDTASFPNVTGRSQGPAYVRPDLVLKIKTYMRIRDCLAGEDDVKRARMKYLPMPNREDQSAENKERYRSYIDRAVFYPAAQRTQEGLIGQIFMRDPTVALPPGIEMMMTECSGDNQTLEQVARNTCQFALGYGRVGVFVDYPETNGQVTAKQLEDDNIQPTIKVFAPWHVPNWRTVKRGGVEIYSMVVIWEGFEVEDDGFELKHQPQYRVLSLIQNGSGEDVYTQTIYQKDNGSSQWQPVETFTPTDHEGNTLDTIPFVFVGAETNSPNIDRPPMDGLCSMNLAHYRNSADYEESVFIVGQPTPVFAGLTEQWVKDVFQGGRVMLGSRSAVPLPVNGSATILQAAPNGMVKEAMDAKERQMVALGAKLVQEISVQRTATETELESTAENSVLASVAKNVGAGIKWALEQACAFTGDDPTKVEFTLSTEFDLAAMDPQERQELIREWQSGAIAFTEMRANLRKAGIASLDDEAAIAAIQEETANALANAIIYTPTAAEAAAGGAGEGGPGAPPADPNAPPSPTGTTPVGGRPAASRIPPKAGKPGGSASGKGTKT